VKSLRDKLKGNIRIATKKIIITVRTGGRRTLTANLRVSLISILLILLNTNKWNYFK
jgi:hypothetical protein